MLVGVEIFMFSSDRCIMSSAMLPDVSCNGTRIVLNPMEAGGAKGESAWRNTLVYFEILRGWLAFERG